MSGKSKQPVKKTIICDEVLQDQIRILKDYLNETTETGAIRKAIALFPAQMDANSNEVARRRAAESDVNILRDKIRQYQLAQSKLFSQSEEE